MTSPHETIRVGRLAVWCTIFLSPRWLVLLLTVLVLIGLSDTVRVQALPPAALERLPGWPWWGWALGALALLLFIALEGAYREIVRKHRETEIEIEAAELENLGLRSRLDVSRKLHHVGSRLLSAADRAEQIAQPEEGRSQSDLRHEALRWQSDTASLIEEALGVRARIGFLRNRPASVEPLLPDAPLPLICQLLENHASYLKRLARELRPLDVLPDFAAPLPHQQGHRDPTARATPLATPPRSPLGLTGQRRPVRSGGDGPRRSPRDIPKPAAP